MLHKAIKGYEDYLVTDTGLVYSLKSQRYLKPRKQNNGYLIVCLGKNGRFKNFTIHRLVANAFIMNPVNKEQVDHINRNRTDNRVDNLRWVNKKEQCINKKSNICVVERINDEVSIGYCSLTDVKGISRSYLNKRTQQGETHFMCKGREFFTEPKE